MFYRMTNPRQITFNCVKKKMIFLKGSPNRRIFGGRGGEGVLNITTFPIGPLTNYVDKGWARDLYRIYSAVFTRNKSRDPTQHNTQCTTQCTTNASNIFPFL